MAWNKKMWLLCNDYATRKDSCSISTMLQNQQFIEILIEMRAHYLCLNQEYEHKAERVKELLTYLIISLWVVPF